MELFKNKSSFRRLVLVCAIQASVQMTGVSAIQYYSPVRDLIMQPTMMSETLY
jgi:hypothetical protein